MLRRTARGFSLVEVVVVTALVTVISAASLIWFGAASQPDTDATAKASLMAYLDVQQQALSEGAGVLDAAQLGERDYTHTYSSIASAGPQDLSVAVSGTLGLAAVQSGGTTCWMVRYDSSPNAASPPIVWYVTQRDPCLASDVTTLFVPTNGDGQSPNAPLVL